MLYIAKAACSKLKKDDFGRFGLNRNDQNPLQKYATEHT
jgi:hypothetical protein